MRPTEDRRSLPAIKVKQWIDDWDKIDWDPDERRAEPPHWFYQFSLPAQDLRALSGVYRRTTNRTSAADDLGIQRRHEVERSREIRRFVQYGYPWSNLRQAQRDSADFNDLRQPGWLPTAIVVNVLAPGTERNGTHINSEDVVEIRDGDDSHSCVLLPLGFGHGDWRHHSIPPIEVIDGQHRLWAFEGQSVLGDFEVPVVAFLDLDLSWQAYLFYTINIKPKRINPSIAFDLYPLLRTQEWLNKFEGPAIYRESRAQEIVDLLWSHPQSPWHRRINMLGESGSKGLTVTQSAWVRSLLASFIKRWEGHRVTIGGLFGSALGSHGTVLPWDRLQQAAFLILMGNELKAAIRASDEAWAMALRGERTEMDADEDTAFVGPNNLLNQDQGVRVLLQVVNDLYFVRADELGLLELADAEEEGETEIEVVTNMTDWFGRQIAVIGFLKKITERLATFDWRSSQAPGLTESERTLKAGFRGSGGYRDLREHVLRHVAAGTGDIANAAKAVLLALTYENRA